MFWRRKHTDPVNPGDPANSGPAASEAGPPEVPAPAPPLAPATAPAAPATGAPGEASSTAAVEAPAAPGVAAVPPMPRSGPRRRLAGFRRLAVSPVAAVVIGFVILTVLTTSLVFFGGTNASTPADGSPAQTLLDWVGAVKGHDTATADSYLSARLHGTGQSSTRLAANLGLGIDLGSNYSEPMLQVTGTTLNGDQALVSFSEQLSSYGVNLEFNGHAVLLKENGRWKIDNVVMDY